MDDNCQPNQTRVLISAESQPDFVDQRRLQTTQITTNSAVPEDLKESARVLWKSRVSIPSMGSEILCKNPGGTIKRPVKPYWHQPIAAKFQADPSMTMKEAQSAMPRRQTEDKSLIPPDLQKSLELLKGQRIATITNGAEHVAVNEDASLMSQRQKTAELSLPLDLQTSLNKAICEQFTFVKSPSLPGQYETSVSPINIARSSSSSSNSLHIVEPVESSSNTPNAGARTPNGKRTALTGIAGIGKTFVAIEMINRVSECAPATRIVFIDASSEAAMRNQCLSILVGGCGDCDLHTAGPWQTLLATMVHLSNISSRPWLCLIDGIDRLQDFRAFETWCKSPIIDRGYAIITTRRLDVAWSFMSGLGSPKLVNPVNILTAADILAATAVEPFHLICCELAQQLENFPPSLLSTAAFLQRTKMQAHEFSLHVSSLLASHRLECELHWSALEMAAIPPSENQSLGEGLAGAPVLCAVLRTCVRGPWLELLDDVERYSPSSIDWIAVLSVLGSRNVSEPLLSMIERQQGSDEGLKALVNFCILTPIDGAETACVYQCYELMYLAVQVWLQGHERLHEAYKLTFRILAFQYPMDDTRAGARERHYLNPIVGSLLRSAESSSLSASAEIFRLRAELHRKYRHWKG